MLHSKFITRIRMQWSMRRDPECFRELARSYWYFLLPTLTVGTLVPLIVGGWLFWRDAFFDAYMPPNSVQNAETLSREQLKTVLEAYRARELNFERLKNTRPAVADPQ